jgi:hypothetical protein
MLISLAKSSSLFMVVLVLASSCCCCFEFFVIFENCETNDTTNYRPEKNHFGNSERFYRKGEEGFVLTRIEIRGYFIEREQPCSLNLGPPSSSMTLASTMSFSNSQASRTLLKRTVFLSAP